MSDEIKRINILLNRLNFYFHEKEWEAIHITREEADTIIRALETKRNALMYVEDDGK